MGLRSTLAGVLTAILLILSCAASTCATNCGMSDLQAYGQATHRHSATSINSLSSDHCGHVAVSQPTAEKAIVGHAVSLVQQCDGKVCCHNQAGTLASSASEDDLQAALPGKTVVVQAVQEEMRLQNCGLRDRFPTPPTQYRDVLRL